MTKREGGGGRVTASGPCPVCGVSPWRMVKEVGTARHWRCGRCGMGRSEIAAGTGGDYDEGYYAGHEERRQWKARIFERHLDRIGRCAGTGTLLDVGTGTGIFAGIAVRRGWRVHACEPSEAAVRVAQRVEGVTLYHGDISSVPRELDGAFDVVTCWEVLEHAEDPAGIIAEASKLLKGRGVLALSVPNHLASYPWWLDGNGTLLPAYHRWLFSRRGLIRLLRRAGLGPCVVETLRTLDIRSLARGCLADGEVTSFRARVIAGLLVVICGMAIGRRALETVFASFGLLDRLFVIARRNG